MNKVFAAKLPDGHTGLSEGGDGQGLSLLALSRAPGTIPSHVNPPKPKLTPEEEPLSAAFRQHRRPASRTGNARAAPSPRQSEGWFSSLARKVGIGGSDTTASAPPPAKPKARGQARPALDRAHRRRTEAAASPKPVPKPADTKQAAAKRRR